jgi:hypothetical protein
MRKRAAFVVFLTMAISLMSAGSVWAQTEQSGQSSAPEQLRAVEVSIRYSDIFNANLFSSRSGQVKKITIGGVGKINSSSTLPALQSDEIVTEMAARNIAGKRTQVRAIMKRCAKVFLRAERSIKWRMVIVGIADLSLEPATFVTFRKIERCSAG